MSTGGDARRSERAVVLALGNRFRRDDGIGPHVLDLLRADGDGDGQPDLLEGRDDALGIIAAWENAALAVVTDAARPGTEPGRIDRCDHRIDLIAHDLAACSSHGLGLAEAVRLGELLGRMPGQLVVYAVQAQTLGTGPGLSEPVRAAGMKVCDLIRRDLHGFGGGKSDAADHGV